MKNPSPEREPWIKAALRLVPEEYHKFIVPQFHILMNQIDEANEWYDHRKEMFEKVLKVAEFGAGTSSEELMRGYAAREIASSYMAQERIAKEHRRDMDHMQERLLKSAEQKKTMQASLEKIVHLAENSEPSVFDLKDIALSTLNQLRK